ncbi:hypothetical protein J6590_015890 [Homalodisca vitripennis]|nr:hypothetical protein J6590_015890 [Homalodisca vitripennis]
MGRGSISILLLISLSLSSVSSRPPSDLQLHAAPIDVEQQDNNALRMQGREPVEEVWRVGSISHGHSTELTLL